jgi:plasmid maintenance system killer protein
MRAPCFFCSAFPALIGAICRIRGRSSPFERPTKNLMYSPVLISILSGLFGRALLGFPALASLQLQLLSTAESAVEMNVPGWNWHALQSDLAGHWVVKVNGNWRLTFSFEVKRRDPGGLSGLSLRRIYGRNGQSF